MANDCVFCKIVNKEITASIVYEDEFCISFYGLTSITDAHVLVVPKKHIHSLLDIEEDDYLIIGKIHSAIKTVSKKLNIDNTGFRVLTNIGKHGQQEILHLHYHVIGGRQLKWEF